MTLCSAIKLGRRDCWAGSDLELAGHLLISAEQFSFTSPIFFVVSFPSPLCFLFSLRLLFFFFLIINCLYDLNPKVFSFLPFQIYPHIAMGEQASGCEGISCCHILTPELSTRQLFTHFFPSLEGGAAEPGKKKKKKSHGLRCEQFANQKKK